MNGAYVELLTTLRPDQRILILINVNGSQNGDHGMQNDGQFPNID